MKKGEGTNEGSLIIFKGKEDWSEKDGSASEKFMESKYCLSRIMVLFD